MTLPRCPWLSLALRYYLLLMLFVSSSLMLFVCYCLFFLWSLFIALGPVQSDVDSLLEKMSETIWCSVPLCVVISLVCHL